MSIFSEVVALIEAELADPTVRFVTGRANEALHTQRRCVKMYRLGGVIGSSMRAGPTQSQDGAQVQASLFSREETVEAILTAENEDAVSELLDDLIHAVERVNPGASSKMESYEWQENEIAQRTALIRLRFQLIFPARPGLLALREVTAVYNTSAIVP